MSLLHPYKWQAEQRGAIESESSASIDLLDGPHSLGCSQEAIAMFITNQPAPKLE